MKPILQRQNGFRIALVALHFAEYSYNLAIALAKSHQVLLILSEENARSELPLTLEAVSNLNVVQVRLMRSPFGMFSDMKRICSLINEFRPDVLHCQEAIQTALTVARQFLRHIPLVVTVHDPTPHSGDGARSLSSFRRLFILHRWRQSADVAIVHGDSLEQQLIASYPRLAGRVFSVPHGPLGGPRSSAKFELGNFLFFGRIHKYKGLAYFVEAIELLYAAGHKVKGVIAGRGPDLEPVRTRVEGSPAFELHERFIGDDELPALFGRAQSVVLPYTDGTQSGVAAMALGFGRPVVSTRVGSVQELVRDGDNGLLVPPCDAVALAAALQRIHDDEGMTLRMGERSHVLGRTELSWARNAEISSQAYEQALALRGCR